MTYILSLIFYLICQIVKGFLPVVILIGSVHTSANLFFHFSNQNGKRTYWLSLSYLHILKYGKKQKKKKMVRKIDHFFIFLVKMELWKIRRQVSHFPSFSFFEHNEKNEKMVRINIIFFIYPFFYFWGKMEKQKNELRIEDYFIFRTFQTTSKIKNSKISLLAIYTLFFLFLKRTSKLEK